MNNRDTSQFKKKSIILKSYPVQQVNPGLESSCIEEKQPDTI
jgi:hypothetical protein